MQARRGGGDGAVVRSDPACEGVLTVPLESGEPQGKGACVKGTGSKGQVSVAAADGAWWLLVGKQTYRAEFSASFQAALAALSARQRNFLRLKYLDGLGIDQLGALYGVHRSTAARWVVGAQEELLDGTRQRLTERLRLTRSQLDSVLRLISSQLDVSLSRLLRTPSE